MNKRQRKKKEKKYLPIISDEANLLTMTTEERENAFSDYMNFREKYAYRKKYKDLKESKPLRYFYPVGKEFTNALMDISNLAMSKNSKFVTVTQSLDAFND